MCIIQFLEPDDDLVQKKKFKKVKIMSDSDSDDDDDNAKKLPKPTVSNIQSDSEDDDDSIKNAPNPTVCNIHTLLIIFVDVRTYLFVFMYFIQTHKDHSVSDDENKEETLNDNEVLPELSDDSDKEDNPSSAIRTSTLDEEDVDDPDEGENRNR